LTLDRTYNILCLFCLRSKRSAMCKRISFGSVSKDARGHVVWATLLGTSIVAVSAMLQLITCHRDERDETEYKYNSKNIN
jgi:hypothetical protein